MHSDEQQKFKEATFSFNSYFIDAMKNSIIVQITVLDCISVRYLKYVNNNNSFVVRRLGADLSHDW